MKIQNALLSLASVMICLALLEVFFRIVPVNSPEFENEKVSVWPGYVGKAQDKLIVPHSRMGYVPGNSWHQDGRFGFQNGKGFDLKAPMKNVVLIGDSIVQYGFLAEALNKRLNPLGFRVWFAGIGGYNTLQEANYLEEFTSIKPDYLIYVFCVNDFSPTMIIDRTSKGFRAFYPEVDPLSASNIFLFENSALFRSIYFLSSMYSLSKNILPDSVYLESHQYIVESGLKKMKSYAARNDAPFRVILIPTLVDLGKDHFFEQSFVLGRKIVSDEGYDFLDAQDIFKNLSPEDLKVTPDTVIHPSRSAQEIVADKFVSKFSEDFREAASRR